MNNYIEDIDNELLEFSGLTEIIQLEPEQSEEAWQITENVKIQNGKLQIYFQALALVAFEEWLQKREPNLSVNRKKISLHPECAQEINAVCNLQVGNFKVCLIPTTSFSDEWIDISQMVIHSPEFANHFYVVIGVDDELEVAGIKGFATHNELVSMTAKMPVLSDNIYELNLAKFHQRSEELLLYLQCLLPTDIKLPSVTVESSQDTPSLANALNRKAVNIWLRMQNKWDEFSEELGWQLLPAPSYFMRFRPNDAEDLESILQAISSVEVPDFAVRRCCHLELGATRLRFYAITWCLPENQENWNLLLILGAIPGNKPPLGLRLQISDLEEVLDEQEFDEENDNLFTLIEGNKEDKFLVTITSADGRDEKLILNAD